MFATSELQALCRQAKTSIQFEALTTDLVRAQERLTEDPDLLQFQKTRFISELDDALSLMRRRLVDPHELLRALKAKQLTDEAEREYWIKGVYEQPDVVVNKAIVDAVTRTRSEAQFDATDVRRRAYYQAERAGLFASWAIDLARTRQSCTHHIRQLLSLPAEAAEAAAAIGKLRAALTKLALRQQTSSAKRFEESLAGMEQVVGAAQGRLDETTSYVIQVILLTTRAPLIEDPDLASHPEFSERLDRLEDDFSRVRFRNERIVYQEDYEPRLERLRAAVQASTNFEELRVTLKEIDDRAKAVAFTTAGERGRNSLNRTYQKLAHATVVQVRDILAQRELDATALLREVEGIASAIAEVDARPIVTRNATRGLRSRFERAASWGDRAIPAAEEGAAEAQRLLQTRDPASRPRLATLLWHIVRTLTAANAVDDVSSELQKLASTFEGASTVATSFPWVQADQTVATGVTVLHATLSKLRGQIDALDAGIVRAEASIEAKYVAYVENISAQLERFSVSIANVEDLHEASDELREINHQLRDTELGLTHAHLARLQPAARAAHQALRTRIADSHEIDTQFTVIEGQMREARRRAGRFNEFDALDRAAKSLGWRVGNSPTEIRNVFQSRIRSLYAGIRSLQARHDQIVREREASQAAAHEHLQEIINEAAVAAEQNPGSPIAWEELVDAQRQLKDTSILQAAQRQQLQALLDAAFQKVKAMRLAFAQRATIVFCSYTDAVQNIQEDLETSDPPPTRAEAFDAIERIKPIRMQLRSEKELLRVHRNEINETLRAISNSIDEILDKASEEMERQRVLMQRRIEVLAAAIDNAGDAAAISSCLRSHRDLSSEILAATLPAEGRRACRSRMALLFDQLTDKREATGRNRFNASNIEATLSRLETQGYFQWMKGAPRIS